MNEAFSELAELDGFRVIAERRGALRPPAPDVAGGHP